MAAAEVMSRSTLNFADKESTFRSLTRRQAADRLLLDRHSFGRALRLAEGSDTAGAAVVADPILKPDILGL